MSLITYPGTFDPITRGHEALVARASALFDKVIIAVALGRHKKPFFTLQERLAMCRETATMHDNVEVDPVRGLLADYLAKVNCRLILRGMRTVSDFEVEMQLAEINHRLAQIETIFMAPTSEYIHVFSSLVREIAELGGEVNHYVRPAVAARLKAKFRRRSRG